MTAHPVVTTGQDERRQRAVEAAVHSSEMEGLTPSAETVADLAEYAEGTVDVDELVRRTKARHGVG